MLTVTLKWRVKPVIYKLLNKSSFVGSLIVSNLGGLIIIKIQRLSYEKKVTPSLRRHVKLCRIFQPSTRSFADR